MHFIAASLSWSVGQTQENSTSAMVAARHLARGQQLTEHHSAAGQLTVGGGANAMVSDGQISAIVINCEHRDDPQIEALARRLASDYRNHPARAFNALPGVYQAVVIDSDSQRVSIGVDRFSIGPMYYLEREGTLLLSSDLSALVGDPRVPKTINQQAIYDYIFFHCIPAPTTIYLGVAKLEPAGVLHWQHHTLTTETSWQPQFAADSASAPPPAQLLEPLGAAVSSRATGQVGAFLSGGLDSSTVAGLLARSVPSAPTFTIGFSAPEYDESKFARVSAEHFATNHHEYFVTPKDIVDAWPTIAAFYSEPFGNSSVIPTYYCARHAAENGIEVMLAGDGGDELFGGNERYTAQAVFERYQRLPGLLRGSLELGYQWLPFLAKLPLSGKGLSYIEQAKMGLPDRLQSYNFLNRFAANEVFEPSWFETIDAQLPWQAWRERYQAAGDIDSLHAMLYLDWKFTLADNDLVKVSNMCELAGIDVRYPMLDPQVVAFAEGVPAPAMNPAGRLRGYYKDGTRGFLPQAVLDKSKHGFGLPFGIWMRDDPALNDMAESALRAFSQRGIIRAAFIDQAISLLRSEAPGYYGELIWILVTLEMWLQSRE